MIRSKFIVAACVAGLFGLTACDNRSADNRTGRNDEVRVSDMNKTDTVSKNDADKKDAEHEQVTGINTNELNKNDVEKDHDKVTVQKEVTRTITSDESVPTVLEGQKKLDINRMSAGDFKAVGIPESTAKNIVDYRDKHDGFRSVDELSQVPGVSASMIAPLRSKLGLSPKH